MISRRTRQSRSSRRVACRFLRGREFEGLFRSRLSCGRLGAFSARPKQAGQVNLVAHQERHLQNGIAMIEFEVKRLVIILGGAGSASSIPKQTFLHPFNRTRTKPKGIGHFRSVHIALMAKAEKSESRTGSESKRCSRTH